MNRWRAAGRALVRVLAVWAVVTATVAALAGILPDFRLQSPDGDSPTQIALTAALAAGLFGLLSALVWPLIVRAILLVPALVLGLLVFFLNGLLLLLALRLIPDGRGTISADTAVVIAAVLSAASSSTNAWLAVYDNEAYRRRLARLAGRRRRNRGVLERDADGNVVPGTVFIQFDGVGHDVLKSALEGRYLPTLHTWLTDGTHRLMPWRTDWSSQTGASQLAILHGSNHDVPAFRWYDKDRGRVMVCNNPSDVAELERRHAGTPGLLAHDGASRGNLFSGGAEQNALVLSVSGRPGRRSRSGYFAYFSDPTNATRTFLSFVAEVFREIGQGLRQRFRDERPRVRRGGVYPFVRAFATVVTRDVVVAAVIGDMLVGRTTVYADLVAYDEVAHHSGVRAPETLRVLRNLDRAVELIAGAARYAPRPYRFVLLSDHGQSQGEAFSERYGSSLEELVRTGCGLATGPGRRKRRRAPQRPEHGPGPGAEARAAALAALGRGGQPDDAAAREEGIGQESGTGQEGTGREHPRDATAPDGEAVREKRGRKGSGREPRLSGGGPVVLASGNLGLVSFPDVPHRMTYEELQDRYPKLLATLTGHPGIGFVLVRGAERGPLVVGAGGVRELGDGADPAPRDEDHPLLPFGPGAARALLRTDAFPHAADLMVNSSHDPATGEVHAFEEQVGSHGGLGGAQGHAFLLHPKELAVPPGELVGAEAVHGVLRGWLAVARGGVRENGHAPRRGRGQGHGPGGGHGLPDDGQQPTAEPLPVSPR